MCVLPFIFFDIRIENLRSPEEQVPEDTKLLADSC